MMRLGRGLVRALWSLAPLCMVTPAFADTTQPYESTTTQLEWLHAPPAWVFFLVICPIVIGFAAFFYRREHIAGRNGSRWVLGTLRVTIILVVIAMLAEPVMRTTRFLNHHSLLLVLVDDSLSMDMADKYSNRELVNQLADFFESTPDLIEDTTRYDLIRRLFRSEDIGFLQKLRDKGNVVLFSFAERLQRLGEYPRREVGEVAMTPEAREVLPPFEQVRGSERVRQTRLSDAIVDAVSSVRGGGFTGSSAPIAGVVLISDGQQTAGSRAPAEVARRLGQRNIPIYSLGVGNPDEAKDIRVVHLEANEVVLAGDRVPFDAAIIADGFEDERVRVDLKFDGVVVDTEYFVLEGMGRRQTVRLEYRPPEPGDFTATVEVEHRGGELFEENNALSKSVRVLEQKIRVLYVDGPPRWEYRYLKNALIRDPTMEAQIFLLSADEEYIQDSSPGLPPLRVLPQTREELFQYHVIVFGDVDIERELANGRITSQQVSLLKEFVYDGGGGVVFVAGPNANPAKYLHTDLYPLLPVEVPESEGISASLGRKPVTSSFNARLTLVGKQHSVLRLVNDYDENVELWEGTGGKFSQRLPGFYWFADTGPEKKSAVVLARHPEKVHPISQKGLVLFAFMNYGKGRTFFSAVENTWRWRRGQENQYFYRFWGQVVRFCATGRLYGKTPRFQISTDKRRFTLGETVNVECRVFDANMKPSTEKTVTAFHLVSTPSGPVIRQLELALDPVRGQGTYLTTIVADRVGVHDLWLGTEADRLAVAFFDVEVPALEMRDPRRSERQLQEIAALSGGKAFELAEVDDLVAGLDSMTQSQQGDIEDDALWDEFAMLVLLTSLLAVEWVLRKAMRLL